MAEIVLFGDYTSIEMHERYTIVCSGLLAPTSQARALYRVQGMKTLP